MAALSPALRLLVAIMKRTDKRKECTAQRLIPAFLPYPIKMKIVLCLTLCLFFCLPETKLDHKFSMKRTDSHGKNLKCFLGMPK